MSWSVTFIGKPENVVNALEEQSAKMEGYSKVEYDSALPHLSGLVKENFGTPSMVIKLTASGHGYASDGKDINRQCTASLEMFYATLV